MEFDNPEVIKSFPGLYVTEHSKKINNETDYSEDGDNTVTGKKELLANKKKKDKKDKDRGYAALEGESSAEDNCDAGTSKTKKTKAFKFSSRGSKEKREKSREKDGERKKEKEKDKKPDKAKSEKKEKKASKLPDESGDIAEGLPIFGVPIDLSIERSGCHDGVAIPIPVRLCIDYVQRHGLRVENVYKLSGPKSRVLHLRRLISQRHVVTDADLDVPVVTSLLKLFLRELPEPLFTADLTVRFEEAGAILNAATREKHLRILLDHLPASNKFLLSWLLLHWDNVVSHERQNRMGAQNLASALHSSLHTSTRLLAALLHSSRTLFDVKLEPYISPLPDSGCRLLPDDPAILSRELSKQESLLSQLHAEIKAGYACTEREERLWEVQRIITQLKRRTRTAQKQIVEQPVVPEENPNVAEEIDAPVFEYPSDQSAVDQVQDQIEQNSCDTIEVMTEQSQSYSHSRSSSGNTVEEQPSAVATVEESLEIQDLDEKQLQLAASIRLLRVRRDALLSLQESLKMRIQRERDELTDLQEAFSCTTIETSKIQSFVLDDIATSNGNNNLEHVMRLLAKENQILQIKKISLVRQIIEQHEVCVNLHAQLSVM